MEKFILAFRCFFFRRFGKAVFCEVKKQQQHIFHGSYDMRTIFFLNKKKTIGGESPALITYQCVLIFKKIYIAFILCKSAN